MENKKSGMHCSVQFCKNKASTRNISFFQYPKDESLVIWVKDCATENLAEALLIKNSFKFCGYHFENSMFLNSTTKNGLIFNAVPTIFNDEILFERSRLAELQEKAREDPPYFDDNLNDQSISTVPIAEGLSSQLGEAMNISDISNDSFSSTATIDSSNQTPGYLSANTPRKQKLAMEIKSVKKKLNI